MAAHLFNLRVALAMGLVTTQSVLAQTAAPPVAKELGQLEEVVVTAEKRSESVQSSALAVSVVSGETLTNKGVTDLVKLNDAVPGIAVDTTLGQSVIYLRGIGPQVNLPQFASTVPFQVDGADIQRETFATGLFDIAQLEVLRGPQGTLYGRNAIGGVVNVSTNTPVSRFEGSGEIEGGNYGYFRSTGTVNLPITDTLYTRSGFQTTTRRGYLSNGAGQTISVAGRIEALYKPDDSFNLLLTALIGRQKGNTADWVPRTCGYSLPGGLQQPAGCGNTPHKYGLLDSDHPWYNPQSLEGNFEDEKNWQLAARMNYTFGNNITLTFVPEYASAKQNQFARIGPSSIGTQVENTQDSEELRLANSAGKERGALNWLVGIYRFKSSTPFEAQVYPATSQPLYYPITPVPGPPPPAGYFPPIPGAYVRVSEPQIDQSSYAAFGQATYSFTDALRATLGARYSTDEEQGTAGFAPSFLPFSFTEHDVKNHQVDWKIGVDFDVTKTSLLYANVQTGYLQGGFSLGGTFKPETLLAYSLGTKNRFLNNRLEVNAEGFYYNYRDYQISFNNPTSGLQEIFNANKATVYGMDISVQYSLTPRDKLDASAALLNAHITEFITPYTTYGDPSNTTVVLPAGTSLAGYDLIQSPHLATSIGYQHDWLLNSGALLAARIDNHYETKHWGDYSLERATYSPSFSKTNLTLNYFAANDAWHAGVYVYNVENAVSFGQGSPYAGTSIAPPRTYGAKVGVKF